MGTDRTEEVRRQAQVYILKERLRAREGIARRDAMSAFWRSVEEHDAWLASRETPQVSRQLPRWMTKRT